MATTSKTNAMTPTMGTAIATAVFQVADELEDGVAAGIWNDDSMLHGPAPMDVTARTTTLPDRDGA